MTYVRARLANGHVIEAAHYDIITDVIDRYHHGALIVQVDVVAGDLVIPADIPDLNDPENVEYFDHDHGHHDGFEDLWDTSLDWVDSDLEA